VENLVEEWRVSGERFGDGLTPIQVVPSPTENSPASSTDHSPLIMSLKTVEGAKISENFKQNDEEDTSQLTESR